MWMASDPLLPRVARISALLAQDRAIDRPDLQTGTARKKPLIDFDRSRIAVLERADEDLGQCQLAGHQSQLAGAAWLEHMQRNRHLRSQ